MKVGITGHQRLENPGAWGWVKSALNNELSFIEQPLMAVSSLAIGADQLFASLVGDRGGEIHVIIPFPGYERTFDPQDLVLYRQLLSKATVVETMHTEGTNEDKYLAAGKRVVELADLMMAVWNGKPAKGKGGTADIVAYAIERDKKLIHFNPTDQSVTKV